MNNTKLSTYTGIRPADTRKLFDGIREAFEDVGIGEISREIPELFMNGTKPTNYKLYLDRLDAVKLLAEQGGYKPHTAEAILKQGAFDMWTMLLAAAQYFLGHEITVDFKTLVLDPADAYIKTGTDAQAKKEAALAQARKTIATIVSPLRKVSAELEKTEAWCIEGSNENSIRLQMDLMLENIGRLSKV